MTGYNTEVIIDLMEDRDDDDRQGGLANVDGDPRRAAKICNQEALCSQILHFYWRLPTNHYEEETSSTEQ